jgi:hypothetical protein
MVLRSEDGQVVLDNLALVSGQVEEVVDCFVNVGFEVVLFHSLPNL